MDNLDKLDFLYQEVKLAESRLAPHDTGHISTAISWLNHRINEVKHDIRESTAKFAHLTPVPRVDKK